MIKVIVAKDYEDASDKAFEVFKEYLKPGKVLGLATGSTPLGLYARMVKDHKENGTSYQDIKSFNLDEYVANVVSAEMPADFDLEALKAQAIVARTYTIYKMTTSKKHKNADICDNSACCQAWISKVDRLAKWPESNRQKYWNKIVNAVSNPPHLFVF